MAYVNLETEQERQWELEHDRSVRRSRHKFDTRVSKAVRTMLLSTPSGERTPSTRPASAAGRALPRPVSAASTVRRPSSALAAKTRLAASVCTTTEDDVAHNVGAARIALYQRTAQPHPLGFSFSRDGRAAQKKFAFSSQRLPEDDYEPAAMSADGMSRHFDDSRLAECSKATAGSRFTRLSLLKTRSGAGGMAAKPAVALTATSAPAPQAQRPTQAEPAPRSVYSEEEAYRAAIPFHDAPTAAQRAAAASRQGYRAARRALVELARETRRQEQQFWRSNPPPPTNTHMLELQTLQRAASGSRGRDV